ncbi:DUF4012 domain-containing protein [Frankia sp. AgB1.9]|uniref:DUF4012 domain-containing protein n=1 Tax=Frankia sp. AgB1.9 TaxID=1836968 RepID=UPI0019321093|nr:DUF4012 domain-containing protein [Frankia sp. AgB1.9]MBL7553377.1 DUF4012 domain-containing protein [Frankia sp. AgB1.9]
MTTDRAGNRAGVTSAQAGSDEVSVPDTDGAAGDARVPAQRSPGKSPNPPVDAAAAAAGLADAETVAAAVPAERPAGGAGPTRRPGAGPVTVESQPLGLGRRVLAAGARVGTWPSRAVLWPRRPRRPSRRALLVGGCVALPVLALVGWVGVRGLLAYHELAQTRADLTRLEQRLLDGDVPPPAQLAAEVGRIDRRTHSARSLTGDPVWSAAGHLPVVGCPMRAAHAMVVAVDGMATGGLPAMAQAADALNPASLRSGMSIDLPALTRGSVPVDRSAVAAQRFRAALDAVPGCGWTGRKLGLTPARDTAMAQARRLTGAFASLKLAVQLAPPMLGGQGEPRRYLLIVQNPAESRANGGIIGGFGLLTAQNGKLSLDNIAGNGALPQLMANSPLRTDPMLPADLTARYGPYEPTRTWANANLTPDYPTAGRFYSGQYQAGTGVSVDGTISIDPTALSYLLGATKPAVMPDGRVITAGNLVKLVESDAYSLINGEGPRDQFFADVGKAVYQAVTAGGGNTAGLLEALGRSVSEGRLLVSSNHADEEEVLAATSLGGALPTGPGPFLAVLTQNSAASKLDYWTRRTVDYRWQPRPDGSGIATITVQVLNAAPDGLPDYVRYRLDLGGPGGNPDGQNEVWLSVYTGVGSQLLGSTLDGRPTTLTRDSEDGHPIASTFLSLDRGKPRTLVLQVWEPAGGPVLTVRQQPLVKPEQFTVEGLAVRRPWSLTASN